MIIYSSLSHFYLTSKWPENHVTQLITAHRCQIWAQSGSDCPKLDKSGTFSDYISEHFASVFWNPIWKSTDFIQIGANQTHFWPKSGNSGITCVLNCDLWPVTYDLWPPGTTCCRLTGLTASVTWVAWVWRSLSYWRLPGSSCSTVSGKESRVQER